MSIFQKKEKYLGDVTYKGAWDADTNSPSLSSGSGTKGNYYVVSVAGTTNLDGITDWQIKDWAIFNGTVWQKVDNTDQVTSVAGRQGAVVLNSGDVGLGSVTNDPQIKKLLAGSTDGNIPLWDGTAGDLLKDGLGLVTTVADPGVDTNVPSEKAVRDAIDVPQTDIDNHKANNGSDHSFIDQDVTSGSSPVLNGSNFTGILSDGRVMDYANVITVSPSGGADFTGVKAAVDSVTNDNTLIMVYPGIYEEAKMTISSYKIFIKGMGAWTGGADSQTKGDVIIQRTSGNDWLFEQTGTKNLILDNIDIYNSVSDYKCIGRTAGSGQVGLRHCRIVGYSLAYINAWDTRFVPEYYETGITELLGGRFDYCKLDRIKIKDYSFTLNNCNVTSINGADMSSDKNLTLEGNNYIGTLYNCVTYLTVRLKGILYTNNGGAVKEWDKDYGSGVVIPRLYEDLDANSKKITSLATGTEDADSVNKAQACKGFLIGDSPGPAYVGVFRYFPLPDYPIKITRIKIYYTIDGVTSVGTDAYDLKVESGASFVTIMEANKLDIVSDDNVEAVNSDLNATYEAGLPADGMLRWECTGIAATTPGGSPVTIIIEYTW